MSVKLAGKLPKDDRDGLQSLERRLVDEPTEAVVAVVILSAASVENRFNSDDEHVVKLTVEAIEPLDGLDRSAATSLLSAAYENRSGKQALPFGTVFDPETGEVIKRDNES